MRPVPIPDEAIWEGAVRRVFTAPDGDLLHPVIDPVEVLVDRLSWDGRLRMNVRCMLEPGDLEKLAGGGHVWVSFYGALPVFSVDVTGPVGA